MKTVALLVLALVAVPITIVRLNASHAEGARADAFRPPSGALDALAGPSRAVADRLDRVAAGERLAGEDADDDAAPEWRARGGRPAVLRYALTFAADGTIDGTFAGIPVQGSHMAHAPAGPLQARGSVSTGAGVFTLTVHGKALVLGTYECGGGECSIIGEVVAGRLRSFLIFTDRLTGTFRGSLTGLYPDEGAWLHALRRWAEAALAPEQAAHLLALARGRGTPSR